MRTVLEKAFILMYIILRQHCIAVTQLNLTACHMFILQLRIYKEKENLLINISIKSHPVFLSASPYSVARATSVTKVFPPHRRRSSSSSMITGFADLMTILTEARKGWTLRAIALALCTTYVQQHPTPALFKFVNSAGRRFCSVSGL